MPILPITGISDPKLKYRRPAGKNFASFLDEAGKKAQLVTDLPSNTLSIFA